jgi:uncharacterized membrane protein YqjE
MRLLQLLSMKFSPASRYFLLGPKIVFTALFLISFSVLLLTWQNSSTYKTTGRITTLFIYAYINLYVLSFGTWETRIVNHSLNKYKGSEKKLPVSKQYSSYDAKDINK